MNTSTTYPTANRNSWVKIATLVAATAAAVMILAGIGAEAIRGGGLIQTTSGDGRTSACQVARDTTLPLQLQSELQAQCAEQVAP